MDTEKRTIDGYEVTASVHIGEGEIVLAEDLTHPEPFMCCNCSYDNPFGAPVYGVGIVSADFLEIVREFTRRIDERVESLSKEFDQRGISPLIFTPDDCIAGSKYEDFKDRLVLIRPERLAAWARRPDNQLVLATGGFGCNPDTMGTAVYATNLFTGKSNRWEREDIMGIIRQERMPAWARERAAALANDGKLPETEHHGKPSVIEKLSREPVSGSKTGKPKRSEPER
jgi:hypothetical protein